MAEILGVVASGIAVTQGAQTLGAIVLSLSRLWRDVRDVPNTIRYMLEELEDAGTVIAIIETEWESPGSTTTPLTSLHCLTIQRCRQAHKDLGDLVEDLRADIASSRRRKKLVASVKVALKKDTLEAYERRLQRALRFLDSAVHLHMASSLKQQPDLIAVKITEALASRAILDTAPGDPDAQSVDEIIDEEEKTFPSSSSEPTWRRRIVRHQRQYRYSSMLLGSLGVEACKIEKCASNGRALPSTSYTLRFAPPRWLLNKFWEIRVSRAYSGWQTFFRPYVVIPSESEVFDVIDNGTFDSLLELFDKGVVSPFSVDKDFGHTLIHWTMMFRSEFLEPLLQLGLDFRMGDEPPLQACFLDGSQGSEAHEVAVHRLLLSHGVYDETAVWTADLVKLRMMRNAQVFDWFVANRFPDFYQWPLKRRLAMFHSPGVLALHHQVASRIFRPQGGFHPGDLHHRIPSTGQTILERITEEYFWLRFYIALFPETRKLTFKIGYWMKQLRLVVRDIAAVAEYSDLNDTLRTKKTILVNAILWLTRQPIEEGRTFRHLSVARNGTLARLRKHDIQRWVRDWLEDLQEGGQDLEMYGMGERAAFLHHYPSCSKFQSPGAVLYPETRASRRTGHKWRGFTFGPRPEDWNLLWDWDPDVERYVGDFWRWIEDPPLAIPGSWVDADGVDEDEYDDLDWDLDEDEDEDLAWNEDEDEDLAWNEDWWLKDTVSVVGLYYLG